MRALVAAAVLAASSSALAADYVVLEAPSSDPGFHAAAAKLAAKHGATIMQLDPASPVDVLSALRKAAPKYVALVLPPQRIDFAFQRRFLDVATRLDDDPFVDFAYGYVTGATGAEAVAFVDACLVAAEKPRPITLGLLGGAQEKSLDAPSHYDLRGGRVAAVRGRVRGGDEDHDHAFLAGFLPKLAKCSAIKVSGHGFPDRVVGTLDASDVAGLRLDGAVVLDGACWNGVTETWWQPDASRVLRRKKVDAPKSVALALLRTGICGYTGFLCPRPQGPELDRDLMELVAHGAALGDARRRDYDKTVLGFLGFGEERMDLEPPGEGSARRADADGIRDIMLWDATGGVLYGDPALRPFTGHVGEDPIDLRFERLDGAITVSTMCPRKSLLLHCDEPAGRIAGKQALKVHARVPLGAVAVGDVTADFVRLGKRDVASRVVWAIEDDRGERFLQLKVSFAREELRDVGKDDDLSLRVTVKPAADSRKARRFGGTVEPPIRE